MTQQQANDEPQISLFYELIRKLTHLGALVIPGSYYLLGLRKPVMLWIMVPLAVLMVIIDIARLTNRGFWRNFAKPILSPIIRPHEHHGDFTGATYILMSFCLTIALYSKPIALAAITFIIVGDALAALLGRKFGRIKFYKNKTIAGSLGCFLGTLTVAILAPGLAFPVALLGAVVAVIFEAFSFGIDDNVTVPILSGLAMTLFEKILYSVNFL